MLGRYSSFLENLPCHLPWSLLAVSPALLCTWSRRGKVSSCTLHRAARTFILSSSGSSDEEEDDIAFSDYRASDSDSGEGTEVYRHTTHSHKLKSKTAKVSSCHVKSQYYRRPHSVYKLVLVLCSHLPEC